MKTSTKIWLISAGIFVVILGITYFLYLRNNQISQIEAEEIISGLPREIPKESLERLQTLAPYQNIVATVSEKTGNKISFDLTLANPASSSVDSANYTYNPSLPLQIDIGESDMIFINYFRKDADGFSYFEPREGSLSDIGVGDNILVKTFENGRVIYVRKSQ